MMTQKHIRIVLTIFMLLTIACIATINTGDEPPATYTPLSVMPEGMECIGSEIRGKDVAIDKPIIERSGGVTYGTESDAEDYNTTTQLNGGSWLNETNAGDGTYQIVDLGKNYKLTGIGYKIHWDGAFANPLTFQVKVSTDQKHWVVVSRVIHQHPEETNTNWVDLDIVICPVEARYVKYEEPPDGEWNGWGNYFQLRVYAEDQN